MTDININSISKDDLPWIVEYDSENLNTRWFDFSSDDKRNIEFINRLEKEMSVK